MKLYAGRMDTTYRIAEVARRSGFSAATLRYYEDIGLLPEPGRSPSGYRQYDDHAVERLAFIARAKQLGCTLEEIAELSMAWDGRECGPVQDRLGALVAAKQADVRARIAELMVLADDRASQAPEPWRTRTGRSGSRSARRRDRQDGAVAARPRRDPGRRPAP